MELLDPVPHEDNLKTLTKEYILKEIVGGLVDVKWGHKVLILDTATTRIIDSVAQMNEITNAGVSDVCIISRKRMNLVKLDAIYFLTATPANVNAIIDDFASADQPKYKRAHLFFSGHLTADLMKKLAESRAMVRIRTLKEAPLEYLVYDSNVFHFGTPKSFYNLYNARGEGQGVEQNEIAEKLTSALAALGENPIIRYARINKNCSAIASKTYEKLEQLRKKGLFKNAGPRGTLIILDRTHDLIAPLVHELTYQAMVEDILELINDVYSYHYTDGEGKSQLREAILNENDPIWRTVRDMHIQPAKTWIVNNFKKFREENKDIAGGHDLTKQLRAMPKFQQLKGKFSVHIDLSKECMDSFNRTGLERICTVEQDLACGLDEVHKKVTVPKDFKLLLQDKMSPILKLRLLLLFYVANPKEMSNRQAWEGPCQFSDEYDRTIANFIALMKQSSRENHQRPPKSEDEWEYVVSRYLPTLHDILNGVNDGTLPSKEYPFLNGEEEAESAAIRSSTQANLSKKKKLASQWSSGRTEKKKSDGPRTVVFITGGVTYSEIRTVHKLREAFGLDIVLGSTHIITPNTFIKQVGALSENVNHRAFKSTFIGETSDS